MTMLLGGTEKSLIVLSLAALAAFALTPLAARSSTSDLIAPVTPRRKTGTRERQARTPRGPLGLMTHYIYQTCWLDRRLLNACERGDARAVDALLARGADPNARAGAEEVPALVLGAAHTEVVRTLIGRGAKLRSSGYDGRTALFAAREQGATEAVRLLEEAQARA